MQQRIRRIAVIALMLFSFVAIFASAPQVAFASPRTPIVHEVFTGKASPLRIIGHLIQLDLYHYSNQQNFSGNFTEQGHPQAISTVTGSKGNGEFSPGTYYIEFTIDSVQSGTACLHCRYTGQFIDNSAMKQARGYWYSPTGQQLGSFYLNKSS